MLKKTLLAATLLAATGAAQAELVHGDFYSGDQMVTVDTETSLAWMKFDLTHPYSINSIEALLAQGKEFEGWSVANYSQVSNLWDGFFDIATKPTNGYGVNFIGPEYGVEIAEFRKFIEFMGGLDNNDTGFKSAMGTFWQDQSGGVMGLAGLFADEYGYGNYLSPEVEHSGEVPTSAGVYLVKDSSLLSLKGNHALNDVPVSGVAFASLGLLGLAGMRRRKAK